MLTPWEMTGAAMRKRIEPQEPAGDYGRIGPPISEESSAMADTDEKWTRARLIPVSGIGSEKEAETRAASAVLAVLSVVRDLSVALFAPMGASKAGKATVETYIEPS